MEWNNGAIAIIISAFLVLSLGVFILMLLLLGANKDLKNWKKELKFKEPFLFYALHILLFFVSMLVAYAILILKFKLSGKGLLQ